MSEKTEAFIDAVKELVRALQIIDNNDEGLDAEQLSAIAGHALDSYDEAARRF